MQAYEHTFKYIVVMEKILTRDLWVQVQLVVYFPIFVKLQGAFCRFLKEQGAALLNNNLERTLDLVYTHLILIYKCD